jgi:hypothetical protein
MRKYKCFRCRLWMPKLMFKSRSAEKTCLGCLAKIRASNLRGGVRY